MPSIQNIITIITSSQRLFEFIPTVWALDLEAIAVIVFNFLLYTAAMKRMRSVYSDRCCGSSLLLLFTVSNILAHFSASFVHPPSSFVRTLKSLSTTNTLAGKHGVLIASAAPDQNEGIPSTSTETLLSTSSTRTTTSMSTLSNNRSTSTGTGATSSALQLQSTSQCDVVVVGGALAGLSAALYLSQIDGTRRITILDRESYGDNANNKSQQQQRGVSGPASFAAAGMLAPQSERLPPGHYLDLCLASRRMYPDFCRMIESLARDSGDAGAPFLYENQFASSSSSSSKKISDPYSVGYVAGGGFLAPAFAGDAVATWAPPSSSEDGSAAAVWLDAVQVRDIEPLLHPDVVGAWWFPDDASVDARRLTCTLRAACVGAGIEFRLGPQYEVESLDLVDGSCRGLWLRAPSTSLGELHVPRYISAQTVLIANGAWMRHLLPVPIESHKGQSMALRMPPNQSPLLSRVLFAQDTYIVPRVAEGRIVIGATVEAGSYDPNVTPAGLLHIMTHALQLVPALKDLPIDETWAGLRPTTPDKGPILGKTPWRNLFVAGGYWRNGVLLAPKTGLLMAKLIASSPRSQSDGQESASLLDSRDEEFLESFAWDRFTSAASSTTIAANARYAASMHPIHRRSSTGVSAAVGTELGSYSSARAAANDRKQDRDLLWSASGADADAAFEKAAALGVQDASAYRYNDDEEEGEKFDESDSGPVVSARYFEGDADAITVGMAVPFVDDVVDGSNDATITPQRSESDIDSVYQKIRDNKSKQGPPPLVVEVALEAEPVDPGFRIFHVDSITGESKEVPPYTSPGDFLASMATSQKKSSEFTESPTTSYLKEKEPANYSETTYDGYQDIQEANSRQSRVEELNAMREARRLNRLGQDEIDYSKIGAQRHDQS